MIKRLSKICLLCFIFISALLPQHIVNATEQTVEAEGSYLVGDGSDESIKKAKEQAKQNALRAASEKTGVYVESYSKIKNNILTQDEVRIITAQILHIQSVDIQPTVEGKDVRYLCKVRATFDPEAIDFNQFIRTKAIESENIRMKEQIKNLEQENEALKKVDASVPHEARKDHGDMEPISVKITNNRTDKYEDFLLFDDIRYDKKEQVVYYSVKQLDYKKDTRKDYFWRLNIRTNTTKLYGIAEYTNGTRGGIYRVPERVGQEIYIPPVGEVWNIKRNIYSYFGLHLKNPFSNMHWVRVYAYDHSTYFFDINNMKVNPLENMDYQLRIFSRCDIGNSENNDADYLVLYFDFQNRRMLVNGVLHTVKDTGHGYDALYEAAHKFFEKLNRHA